LFEHIATFVHKVFWHARNQDLKRWERTHPILPTPTLPSSPNTTLIGPPPQRHAGPRRQRLTTQRLRQIHIFQPHLLCPLCHYPTDRYDPHNGCPRVQFTQTQLPIVYAEYLRTNTTLSPVWVSAKDLTSCWGPARLSSLVSHRQAPMNY